MLGTHTLPFLGGVFLYSISFVLDAILVKEGEGFLAQPTERALKYTRHGKYASTSPVGEAAIRFKAT